MWNSITIEERFNPIESNTPPKGDSIMKTICRRPTFAVLKSFTSWWLTWVVAVVYLVGAVLTVCLGWNHTKTSQSLQGDWTGTNWEFLPDDLSKVESIAISPIYLIKDPLDELQVANPNVVRELAQKHYAFRPDSPLRIPGKLPALKHLVLWGSVNEDQLVKLLEFQQLKSLYIVYLGPLTNRGWSALERQPLETLGILGLDQSTWNEARWPQTLRRMLVQVTTPVLKDPTPSHLLPLVKLPHLETLRAGLWPNAEGKLREQDVEALSQMRSLKNLYLDFMAKGTEQEILEQLPGISVRPSFYQSSRVSRVLALTGLGLLPLLFLLHLLSLQFVASASSLVPGFKLHHGMCALFLFGGGWAIQTAALVGVGCHWLSALALAPVVLVPVFLITRFFDQSQMSTGFVSLPYLLNSVIISMPLLSFLTWTWAPEADWFFHGKRTDIALILFLAEALSVAGFFQFFYRLNKKITQHNDGPLVLGFFNGLNLQTNYPKTEKSYLLIEKLWGRGQQTRLRAALDCPFPSPARQSLLWRASQIMTSTGFSILMTASMLGAIILFSLIFFVLAGMRWNPQGFSAILPALMMPLFYLLFIPSILLAQRCPFLANHLLMSVTRRDWVRLVFRETALDFVPFLVVLIVGLLGYSYWQPANGWPVWHLGLLIFGLVGLVYAGTLILVTLKVTGKILFVLASISTLVGLGLLAILIEAQDQHLFLGELLGWPPTFWVSTLLVAALGCKIAHHRWMNWQMA